MADEARITVSREALRAELLDLELRLVERLNTLAQSKASIEALNAVENHVNTLALTKDAEHRGFDTRLNVVERRIAVVYGVASVVGIAAAVVSQVILHFLHHG